MSAWLASWRDRVRDAQIASDADALSALYAESVENLGTHEASRVWLAEMSAWDASAITG